MTQKTIIINGEEVPVIPAKAEEEVINKRTQKKYASKEDFDNDVADSNTDTVKEDLQINQKITVASLQVFGKTMIMKPYGGTEIQFDYLKKHVSRV
jgi:hypothetical protein